MAAHFILLPTRGLFNSSRASLRCCCRRRCSDLSSPFFSPCPALPYTIANHTPTSPHGTPSYADISGLHLTRPCMDFNLSWIGFKTYVSHHHRWSHHIYAEEFFPALPQHSTKRGTGRVDTSFLFFFLMPQDYSSETLDIIFFSWISSLFRLVSCRPYLFVKRAHLKSSSSPFWTIAKMATATITTTLHPTPTQSHHIRLSPAPSRKRNHQNAAPPITNVTTQNDIDGPRQPKLRITASQKQALIENLQLESESPCSSPPLRPYRFTRKSWGMDHILSACQTSNRTRSQSTRSILSSSNRPTF